MSENTLSEQAKVEMMKLAVEMTQQYAEKNIGNGTLAMLGLDSRILQDVTILDLIDHLYEELCERLNP